MPKGDQDGAGAAPAPVVVVWGGIDGFKEERRSDTYLALGLAVLMIDMPGVGDAPLAGSENAERMWDSIFDWIATRPETDADRWLSWARARRLLGRQTRSRIATASEPLSIMVAAPITPSRPSGSPRRSLANTRSS